jgi:hypothetical protein
MRINEYYKKYRTYQNIWKAIDGKCKYVGKSIQKFGPANGIVESWSGAISIFLPGF